MAFELAQVNIARLLAPLESPALADFVANLEPVNASADTAPGFVWRLQTEAGDATSITAFEWDVAESVGVIVNMSVWRSVEALADRVYGDMHLAVLRRRREWFHRVREATVALWWVPEGHRPTTGEAEARVRHLRTHGPSETAFTFRVVYPAPGDQVERPARAEPGRDDWLCPA